MASPEVYQRLRVSIPENPWVVVEPKGVMWVGRADSELNAWTMALGWPSNDEIQDYKNAGFYAAEATITWKKPT